MRPNRIEGPQNHANPTFNKVFYEICTTGHRIVTDKRIHFVVGLPEF